MTPIEFQAVQTGETFQAVMTDPEGSYASGEMMTKVSATRALNVDGDKISVGIHTRVIVQVA